MGIIARLGTYRSWMSVKNRCSTGHQSELLVFFLSFAQTDTSCHMPHVPQAGLSDFLERSMLCQSIEQHTSSQL